MSEREVEDVGAGLKLACLGPAGAVIKVNALFALLIGVSRWQTTA